MGDRFLAYYRVSTAKQGRSGLGLDAQVESVEAYVASVGGELLPQNIFEIESGKRADNRPQLQMALQVCRLTGATLVVAKLDRLSRNAAFLMTLRDSGVQFVAADMPTANSLTVGILALMAQHEREAISARTKAALAAAKARGAKLGGNRGRKLPSKAAGKASGKARRAIADDRAKDMAAIVQAARSEGAITLRQIAASLMSKGIRTPRGGAVWHPSQVKSALERIAKVQARQRRAYYADATHG